MLLTPVSAFLLSYILHSPASHICQGTGGARLHSDVQPPLLLFHRSQSTPKMIAAVLREIFSVSFQFLRCTSELTQRFFLSPPFDLLLISALLPTPSLPSDPRRQRLVLNGLKANAARKPSTTSASAVLSDASPDPLDPLSSGGVESTQVTPQAGKVTGNI